LRAASASPNAILERIDFRAFALALIGRHFAERRQQSRNRALFTERADADGFQSRFVAGVCYSGEGLRFELGEIVHRVRILAYIGIASASCHARKRLKSKKARRSGGLLDNQGAGSLRRLSLLP
jgi:hypothetical protein